jgi:mono/diheme cytochrome c family protein
MVLLFGLLATLSGCGSARRDLPSEETLLATNMAQGEQVFLHYCHQCHPAGQAGVGPALNNKPLPKFLMKIQVRHGLGAMPGFSEETISSPELDQLTAYLIALRQTP